jgi:DNA-binding MarR family transcriptional regulator
MDRCDAAELHFLSSNTGIARETLLKKSILKTAAPRAKSSSAKTPCPWAPLSRNGANLNVEDFVTFRLTRLSNSLRNNLTKRYLEEFELSLPEWRLLALVTRFSPLRFSELTQRSHMDKGQVSRTLRVMTDRGLTKTKVIAKRGSRSADALAAPVSVAVTAKGKALYKKVMPVAQRRQSQLLELLSPTERLALFATLEKLYAVIGDASAENDAI